MSDIAYCGPCTINNKQTTAITLCFNCQETLCAACTEVHKGMKMARGHDVTYIGDAPQNVMSIIQNHSCCSDHDNARFTLFCVHHDTLCCEHCYQESHRKCSYVKTLDKSPAESTKFVETKENFSFALDTIDNLLSKQKELVEHIKTEAKQISKMIEKQKDILIENIEQLANSKLKELDEIKNCEIEKAKINTERAKVLIPKMRAKQEALTFVKDKGLHKLAFTLAHSLQKELDRNEKALQEINMTSVKLALRLELNDLLDASKEIGIINLSFEEPDVLKPFKRRGSQTAVSQTSLHGNDTSSFKFEYETNIKQFVKQFNVTGMTVSESGLLLMCDFDNKRVIVCSSDGNYQDIIQTKYKPWDIVCIPETQIAAVSTRDEGFIQFIDIQSRKIKSEILLNRSRGGGIAIVKSATTNLLLGSEKQIHVIDYRNDSIKVIYSIDVPTHSSIWYLSDSANNRICYSDSTDSELHLVHRQNKTTNSYRSEKLKTPMKIVTDENDNLYVVGRLSNNIHRLSADGSFKDIILEKKDGIEYPNAICFNTDYSKLYVSNKRGKSLAVFSVNRDCYGNIVI